jgi:hypothetical protein
METSPTATHTNLGKVRFGTSPAGTAPCPVPGKNFFGEKSTEAEALIPSFHGFFMAGVHTLHAAITQQHEPALAMFADQLGQLSLVLQYVFLERRHRLSPASRH